MGEQRGPRRAERNAGAFLAPDATMPVPMRTLSDDYHDRPVDPPDDRVPEPEPPGLIDRVAGALRHALGQRPE
jgi:hypothetical protein